MVYEFKVIIRPPFHSKRQFLWIFRALFPVPFSSKKVTRAGAARNLYRQPVQESDIEAGRRFSRVEGDGQTKLVGSCRWEG